MSLGITGGIRIQNDMPRASGDEPFANGGKVVGQPYAPRQRG